MNMEGTCFCSEEQPNDFDNLPVTGVVQLTQRAGVEVVLGSNSSQK
jgi:hypothetical protein